MAIAAPTLGWIGIGFSDSTSHVMRNSDMARRSTALLCTRSGAGRVPLACCPGAVWAALGLARSPRKRRAGAAPAPLPRCSGAARVPAAPLFVETWSTPEPRAASRV